MIKFLVSKIKGTHYVHFNSSKPIAFSVNDKMVNEVKYKISYTLCFKFFGIYIPVQNNTKLKG